MKRRSLVLALVAMCGPSLTHAQPKPARIAYLTGYSAEVDKPLLAAFKRGLDELGYVEGSTVVIEARHAGGQPERLPSLAAELASLKPHIFVVGGSAPAAVELRKVAGNTPIVMANVQDPVASGLVRSLARPGGNITGMSDFHAASVTKRLDLMKEAIPGLRRVAVLWNQDSPSNARQLEELKVAAPTLGLTLVSAPVRRSVEIEPALRKAMAERGTGILMLGDFVLTTNMHSIAKRAIEHRVPAVYTISGFTAAGGFMAYGANFEDLYRRSARFVDRILKGANPGNLPIEQPTKFDLIINLKTAKAIGVTVPHSLLARADDVIQ